MVKKPFIYKLIIRNCDPNKGFMEVNFFVENNNEIEEVVVFVEYSNNSN